MARTSITGSNFNNRMDNMGLEYLEEMSPSSDMIDSSFWLGGAQADGKGGMIKNNGVLGAGLSAFNAWNSWDQGNKMYDLSKDRFDFSKDKFWNNYAQKSDLTNRAINTTNSAIDYKINTMQMTPEDQAAYERNQSTDYYKGDRIKEVDGSYTQVGQPLPSQYQSRTTARGTPTTSTPAASNPQSLVAKSNFAKVPKPKKLTI